MVRLDTLVGGAMLVLSLISLGYGLWSGAKDRNIITGEKHAGVYILVGFALLAMGIMVFLLGVFRSAS